VYLSRLNDTPNNGKRKATGEDVAAVVTTK
jgi:hypothetical protein